MQKALNALMKYCLLGPLQSVPVAYLWFILAVILFQVLLQRANDFVSLKQQETDSEDRPSPLRSNPMETTARNR